MTASGVAAAPDAARRHILTRLEEPDAAA